MLKVQASVVKRQNVDTFAALSFLYDFSKERDFLP